MEGVIDICLLVFSVFTFTAITKIKSYISKEIYPLLVPHLYILQWLPR